MLFIGHDSTPLVQTKISQLLNGFPWNVGQDIHGAQSTNPADFSIYATMMLALLVLSEIIPQLLDRLS